MIQTSLVPFAPSVLHTGFDGESVLDSFIAPVQHLLYPLPRDVRGTFAGLLDTLQALRPMPASVPALTSPSGTVIGQWLTPLVGGHCGVALLTVDVHGRSLDLEWTVTTAGMVSALSGEVDQQALMEGALRPDQFVRSLHVPAFRMLVRERGVIPPFPELGERELLQVPRAPEGLWSAQRQIEPSDTPLGFTPYGLLRASLSLGSGIRTPGFDPFASMLGFHVGQYGEVYDEPISDEEPAFSRLLSHGVVRGSVRLIARPGHRIDLPPMD